MPPVCPPLPPARPLTLPLSPFPSHSPPPHLSPPRLPYLRASLKSRDVVGAAHTHAPSIWCVRSTLCTLGVVVRAGVRWLVCAGAFVRALGEEGVLNAPRAVACFASNQPRGPPGRGATALPAWTGAAATTALLVCEQRQVVTPRAPSRPFTAPLPLRPQNHAPPPLSHRTLRTVRAQVVALSLLGQVLQTIVIEDATDLWAICVSGGRACAERRRPHLILRSSGREPCPLSHKVALTGCRSSCVASPCAPRTASPHAARGAVYPHRQASRDRISSSIL